MGARLMRAAVLGAVTGLGGAGAVWLALGGAGAWQALPSPLGVSPIVVPVREEAATAPESTAFPATADDSGTHSPPPLPQLVAIVGRLDRPSPPLALGAVKGPASGAPPAARASTKFILSDAAGGVEGLSTNEAKLSATANQPIVMLRLPDGRLQTAAVGAWIGGWRLARIAIDRAELRRGADLRLMLLPAGAAAAQ